jgi:hypothetical protein
MLGSYFFVNIELYIYISGRRGWSCTNGVYHEGIVLQTTVTHLTVIPHAAKLVGGDGLKPPTSILYCYLMVL